MGNVLFLFCWCFVDLRLINIQIAWSTPIYTSLIKTSFLFIATTAVNSRMRWEVVGREERDKIIDNECHFQRIEIGDEAEKKQNKTE
ncbi:CLUMA_CG009298, isoform A [Clunio marinus]|uniref:CLUMA_CG009298, isoform A n=1 Tax=Clunio marinus TaxID=568069 RepID=A0A1J1I6M8_9DIPT|nr:CLUMA_CG009298, isoform A [Clunio marinus]